MGSYNPRAELVFYGPLIAWSVPREGKDPGRVVDVGQALLQGMRWRSVSAQADP